jgi:hypothetical protein
MTENEIDSYPTEKQMKAIKKLEAVFEECRKENVLFHVVLGNIHAYNGRVVFNVDGAKEDGIPVRDSDYYFFTPVIDIESWADDAHYVHFKKVKK